MTRLERIRVDALIKRLQQHALGPADSMTKSQVAAAKILIDKAVPNAPTTNIVSGDPNAPITIASVKVEFVKAGRDKS